MDVTVAIATYGDSSWIELARTRALPSAASQARTIHVHGATLHEARNEALEVITTEWVIHLDADDELAKGYIEAMSRGTADLRAPAVRYVYDAVPAAPRVPQVAGHHHRCTADCLAYGNWIVVGAAVRTDLVREVGGWRDFSWSEDYDLWVRCWQAGATIETVREACYIAHVRRDSRNRGPSQAERLAVHQSIARANGLPVPA